MRVIRVMRAESAGVKVDHQDWRCAEHAAVDRRWSRSHA